MNSEEEIPDWEEMEEEVPPPALEKKWEREEREESGVVSCPACDKLNRKDALSCIYCDERLAVDSGFLGWIAHLTTNNWIN